MWAFVLSLAPLFVLFIPFVNVAALILPVVAIPLGIVGLRRTLRSPERYRGAGFAIAALVISAVLLVLVVIAAFFITSAVTAGILLPR